MIDQTFLDTLDEEIREHNVKAKRREQATKYMRLFLMPKEADSSGDRRQRVRFLTPWAAVAQVLVHDKWQHFSQPCPAQYGKPCQYCKMTEEEKRTQKIKDQKWFLWTVWNYSGGRDGTGEMQLFSFQVNNASPVKSLHSLMEDKFQEAAENAGILPGLSEFSGTELRRRRNKALAELNIRPDITQFDVIIVQHGAGQDRTFDATPRTPSPFKGTAVAQTAEHMRDSLTFIKDKTLLGLSDEVEEEQGAPEPPDELDEITL